MQKLVIVESPSKVKTITKYINSKDYLVIASRGHVVDLPKSSLGIDIEKDYQPQYEITQPKALSELRKAFSDKDELILAVDPDREGEAIGWHVAIRLGVINAKGTLKKGKKLSRITFTSITKEAVEDALKNPRGIDYNLVDAQQARRVLDRLVGYKLSPLLWQKIRYGLSAGRVQSVALRLVVEREEEREKFDVQEYWSINGLFSPSSGKIFKPEIKLTKTSHKVYLNSPTSSDDKTDSVQLALAKINGEKFEVSEEREATTMLDKIIQVVEWRVKNIDTKEIIKATIPPFTTSTLQQVSSNKLGFSPKKTMSLAQKLYESGHITYMRTDSTELSSSAIEQIRTHIKKVYGDKLLPQKAKIYKTATKVAQEAHEAIRPTNPSFDSKKLKFGNEAKELYDLILHRTLGSQMIDAILQSTKIEVEGGNYLFSGNFQQIKEKGFMLVYHVNIAVSDVPLFTLTQPIYLSGLNANQSFTQPPARYSEASLIKALEAFGIGRPSTYVPTLMTIQGRGYVSKEGRYLVPTDTGKVVTALLRDHFKEIVDYGFTAEMENKLDHIANGNVKWIEMIDEFYKTFEKNIEKQKVAIKRGDYTNLGNAPKEIICPVCSAQMQLKLGKYGRFYSCSKWPECKGMLGIDGKSADDIKNEATSKEFLKFFKPAPQSETGQEFELRQGQYGKYWAHPDYPKVKDARPLEYNKETFLAIYGPPPKAPDGKEMILKRGRFGEFWAHPDYPQKKIVLRINQKQIREAKASLGLS